MSYGLMEFLGSIQSGEILDFSDPEIDKAYCPFPINNGLAQHIDTVMLAQEMNKRPYLSKHMQYLFLYHSVSKKRRYGKWAKKIELPEQSDVDLLKELYQVSQEVAEQYLTLMNPEEIETLRVKMFKGGSSKVRGSKK